MKTQGGKVIQFMEEFLTLGGSFHGEPFKVLDFQREVIEDIYRLDDDGKRLHRTYLLGLPRKNAKTTLAVLHYVAPSGGRTTNPENPEREAMRLPESDPTSKISLITGPYGSPAGRPVAWRQWRPSQAAE